MKLHYQDNILVHFKVHVKYAVYPLSVTNMNKCQMIQNSKIFIINLFLPSEPN